MAAPCAPLHCCAGRCVEAPCTAAQRIVRRHVTIREFVARRVLIGYALTITGMLVFLYLKLTSRQDDDLLFALGSLPLVAGVITLVFWVRCPRCKTKLGTGVAAHFTFVSADKIKCCPFCGVSVDEEVRTRDV